MQALRDYQKLIAEVNRRCRRILNRHKSHIVCTKGCAGNCCRIHIAIYPEYPFGFDLQKRIRSDGESGFA